MDIGLIVLRLFHIVSGVFWAGAAFFNVLLLEPAVKASGPEGQKTMGTLQRIGFATTISAAAGITMLSGLLLYGRDSGGFQPSWIGSAQGIVFTIGAVAGIIGGAVGGAMVGRAGKTLGELGASIAQSGGKPTAEQTTEIAALQNRVHFSGQLNAILLLVAVICMAVAPELASR